MQLHRLGKTVEQAAALSDQLSKQLEVIAENQSTTKAKQAALKQSERDDFASIKVALGPLNQATRFYSLGYFLELQATIFDERQLGLLVHGPEATRLFGGTLVAAIFERRTDAIRRIDASTDNLDAALKIADEILRCPVPPLVQAEPQLPNPNASRVQSDIQQAIESLGNSSAD